MRGRNSMTHWPYIRATFLGACFAVGWLLATSGTALAQNVIWGPFNMTLGFATGVEYTDNVDSSETNPKSDLKLTFGPTLAGSIALPLTLRGGERLTLSTGFSYTYEVSLTRAGKQEFSSPITASLVLPIAFENWSVVVSEAFSLRNDPLERTVVVS